jgi:uncharacterized protein (TIGR00369 family)
VTRPNPRTGDPFAEFLGLRWDGADAVRLTIRPPLLNSVGRLLGPVGFALVDYSMAAALWETTAAGESIATTNISINFVATAREGDVVCRSSIDHRGRRAAFLRSELRHEESGRLLATAIGTFAVFGATR